MTCTYRKIIILGAITWPCFIENHIIMRHVKMRLNCMSDLCMSHFVMKYRHHLANQQL